MMRDINAFFYYANFYVFKEIADQEHSGISANISVSNFMDDIKAMNLLN
ncbi:MAG: hypothetical protein ACLFMO_02020 [Eubacteriales bacterium]